MGFEHVLIWDHVVGTSLAAHPDLTDAPTSDYDPTHEPLALIGHLAAVTQRQRYITAVVILPQRQATLVAKQVATVDILSGVTFTLGVGIGWNALLFQALDP